MKKAVLFVLCLLLVKWHVSKAQFNQPGQLDTTFNYGLPHQFFVNLPDPSPGFGADAPVNSTILHPDGKLIVVGEFLNYNGRQRVRIVRLNANGFVDTTFNPGSGADAIIHSFKLQQDGKIIIGGDFLNFNGIPRNRIARLNSNGSIDTSFNPGSGANSSIFDVSLQSDGKVVIAGNFTQYSGVNRSRIARLNTNGSLDTSFIIGAGFNNLVYTTEIQTNGRIVVGGNFTSYNSISRARIARLNENGSIDTTFLPGTGAAGAVRDIVILPDQKIIIAGDFTSFNSTTRNRIARLNTNGSLDAGFTIGTGANAGIYAVKLLSNNQILIGGNFLTFNGQSRRYLARLNENGSLNGSFLINGGGASAIVKGFTILPDVRIIVNGSFQNFQGTGYQYLVRTDTLGNPDIVYNLGFGAFGSILKSVLLPNGQIVTVGFFEKFNSYLTKNIARINPNGTLDTTLRPGQGTSGEITDIVVQSDGKYIICGNFGLYNDTIRNRIVRILPNGNIDPSFVIGTGFNGDARSLVLQPDGKVLVAGIFTSYNGNPRNRIARINQDGSIDNSFNANLTVNDGVSEMELQSDGKIVIVGNLISYPGGVSNKIARLNPGGSLDTSFNVTNVNAAIFDMVQQSDGKILAAGNLTLFAVLQWVEFAD
jgi:uncharacterized delta-60 repeat protein